jgi:hypothetical protein
MQDAFRRRTFWAAAIAGAAFATAAGAQSSNQFGGQSRADAASQMIVLGVQQGISSMPPTSGQAFTYDYNAELGAFVASEQLGPTVLRSPQTIGANRLSVRMAASYFDLNKTMDPIIYQFTVPQTDPLFGKFGMSVDAKVTLLNFAVTYGITDKLEVTLNVPVTVVDAHASQSYTVQPSELSQPPPQRQLGVIDVGPNPTDKQINQAFQGAFAAHQLTVASSSFNTLGFGFNEGTHAGVGRISVGGKMPLYDSDRLQIAFSPEFYCNSPSQNEFAGSNSPALLVRAIGQYNAMRYLRLHMDIGDDHDFQVSELSRFVWNAGVSVPLTNITFDTGVGGSKFDTAIQWTPTSTTADIGNGVTVPGVVRHSGANELGTNYVDYLFGVKARIVNNTVLSGAVNVPITSDGFRAAAVGTVALEYYF